jgi:hypothetical protein
MEELLPGYTYQQVNADTLMDIYRRLETQVYGSTNAAHQHEYYQESDKPKLELLGANFDGIFRQNLVVYCHGEPIGWIWGRQTDFETFAIVNAGLLPAHKGKGVYAALFAVNLQLLLQKGFQLVRAFHGIGNSATMMVKLKHGFLVDGMEFSERFGPLIRMCYFANPERKEAFIERTTRDYPF